MSLGVAVAGTGFGANTIVPAFNRIRGVHIVGVCGGTDSAKTKTVAQAHGIPKWDATFEALCESDGVDLVAIASPHEFHCDMVRVAMAKQKHILCEKPLALTSQEVDALCAMSRRSERLHLMNHQLRFHRCIREIRERMRRGDVGQPRQVHVRYRINRYVGQGFDRREWWFKSERGGGLILAMAPHLIDLVQFWLGNTFATVRGTAARMLDEVQVADGRTISVDAESAFTCAAGMTDGTEVFLSATAVSPSPMALEIEIVGSEGELLFRSPETLRLARVRGGESSFTELCREDTRRSPDGSMFQQAFQQYAAAIVEALETGNRDPIADATDFSDYGYKHRVIAALRRSIADGRPVSVEPPA